MKLVKLQELLDYILTDANLKILSTKVSRRKVTYSVEIDGEKVDFQISKNLVQLQ